MQCVTGSRTLIFTSGWQLSPYGSLKHFIKDSSHIVLDELKMAPGPFTFPRLERPIGKFSNFPGPLAFKKGTAVFYNVFRYQSIFNVARYTPNVLFFFQKAFSDHEKCCQNSSKVVKFAKIFSDILKMNWPCKFNKNMVLNRNTILRSGCGVRCQSSFGQQNIDCPSWVKFTWHLPCLKSL